MRHTLLQSIPVHLEAQPFGWKHILWLLLLVAGCSSNDVPVADGSNGGWTDDSVAFSPDSYNYDINSGELGCSHKSLQTLRISPWPGGGIQISFIPLEEGGTYFDALADLNVAIETLDGTMHPAALSSAAQTHGLLAIAIKPDVDPEIHQQRVLAATTLVEGLPQGERISLWSLGEEARLLADFTPNKEHILRRLQELGPQETGEDNASMEEAEKALKSVESRWGTLVRNLVIIGADPMEKEPLADGTSPLSFWWISNTELAQPE